MRPSHSFGRSGLTPGAPMGLCFISALVLTVKTPAIHADR